MSATDTVEELLARCLERSEGDWPEALEQACQEHPQHAEELRARWGLLQGLGLSRSGEVDEAYPERLGDFRLLRPLGSGGMGVVFLAEQESLGRRVALKLIRPEHLYFPGARIRFRREVESAARLRHRGIVPVHLVGEEGAIPYYAMEWIQGCSLADLLDELRGRRPEELRGQDLAEALSVVATRLGGEEVVAASGSAAFQGTWTQACLRLVRQVAAALGHAHERGVLHRDVKCSNILITLEGEALLVDFGLASSSEATPITRTGSEIGSLPCMAPERFQGVADDPRSDVYSLGVSLYELLTLRSPFLATSAEEVRRRILVEEAAPVRALNPQVQWDEETVCQVAMEKDRGHRYASAAEFEADLVRLLEHRPIRARRPGALLRARRWAQRHPARTVALALGLAVAWGAPVSWWMLERAHRTEVEQRLAERNRLKDHKVLSDLLQSESQLHPADPRRAPALEAWLESAAGVERRRSLHRRTRERLQAELDQGTVADPGAWAWEVDVLAQVESMLDQVLALRPEMTARHQFAASVAQRSLQGPEAVELWEEAAFDIEESSQYGGLLLAPQLGLLPLETDPESGLWEFWHLQSGERPERDPDTGRWRITEATGIVLVLVPGGRFAMGCEPPSTTRALGQPGVDPRCNATGIEGPIHEVELDPFFLSKYEMTQAQWLRCTGENPSSYQPGRATPGMTPIQLHHPVEAVDWFAATRVLGQLGLNLPTESQWEYACRAGTTTVFHFGDDPALTPRHANVLDARWLEVGHERAEAFDDAFWHHAPVGSFEPNPFGLHDVHGNVYEWCQDRWSNYDRRTARNGDGLRDNPGGTRQRVVRGGAWVDGTLWARSAARHFAFDDSTDNGIGLRPARAVQPVAEHDSP